MRFKYLYILYLFIFCQCGSSGEPVRKRVIALAVFSGFDLNLIHFIKLQIESFYGCRVVLLPQKNLPESAFYPPRNRYRADSLLVYLKANIPDSADHILGLTASDISVTTDQDKDWGVFGYGYCPGKSSVASTFRLTKNTGEKKTVKFRIKNVVLHELGHNFGLAHCKDKECLMKDAHGKLSSVEGESLDLCLNCQSKINVRN